MAEQDRAPGGIDTTTPNVARIYDYLLRGRDNLAADGEAAKRLITAIPDVAGIARDNRSFVGRVVRYLAVEGGIRQCLTSADLHAADLTRADLHGADLHAADLAHAGLTDADLHRRAPPLHEPPRRAPHRRRRCRRTRAARKPSSARTLLAITATRPVRWMTPGLRPGRAGRAGAQVPAAYSSTHASSTHSNSFSGTYHKGLWGARRASLWMNCADT